MVTLDDVKKNKEVQSLIAATDKCMRIQGYPNHGVRHVGYVSATTENILRLIGCDERTAILGSIAGWLHDIGNSINRFDHGITGATIAYGILKDLSMDYEEINTITAAIGSHEETKGNPVNNISAALIIADKSDANRNRLENIKSTEDLDMHDYVNLAITKNILEVDKISKTINLKITMKKSSSIMDYLKIYINRILISEKAAKFFDYTYVLYINDVQINNTVLTKKVRHSIEKEEF